MALAERCEMCRSRKLTDPYLELITKWGSALWWVRWCRKCGAKNTKVYR